MPLGVPSRTYLAGELIHREVPFVKILPREMRDVFCETCYKRCSKLRFCARCLAVKYCGKVCQKRDWSDHRSECKNMKNLPEEKGVDIVRLVGRVIHKIKGKEWKSIKTTVLGAEVNFDDIDPHYKEMTENPILNLLYKELQDLTRKFIGAANTPSDIDMLKIIGKVIYNSFLSSKTFPGVCFFLGIFVFEEQCIPNSSFTVYENSLNVWSNKKIVKNSEKISVSFRTLFDDTPLRICTEIDDQPCHCSDCSLPYGESVLSKIMDDKKAYSVISTTQNFLHNKPMELALKFDPMMQIIVDEILEMHRGVLGRTNILHLKMLFIRYLLIGGHPREIEPELTNLETIMRSVFGEYSREVLIIYTLLIDAHRVLRHTGLELFYRRKMERIGQIFSINVDLK